MSIRNRISACVLALLAVATLLSAQKTPERPKVHSDFAFNSMPPSREAAALLSKDKIRYMLVAFHEGWSFEKIGKEMKLSDEEVDKLFSDLDAEKLASLNQDGDPRPAISIIREKEISAIKATLTKHSEGLAKVIAGNWSQIEAMAASLNGAKAVPKEELMYDIVVSGILFGAMYDVLYEDKTLIPPGPRRGRGQRYFAWLVEGDPKYAGRIQREESFADGNIVVTIGAVLPMTRPTLGEIRGSKSMILDEAESRRLRSFMTIFCKDQVMPYLKANRNDLIKVATQLRSGKYLSFGEFLAWYYNLMANNAVDEIAASGRLKPPTDFYAYATKTLQ